MQSPYSSPSPDAPLTPMNAPVDNSSEFAPMPLRARGVLEQLDLSIKVYRRYFGALSSWAALVMGACTVIGLFGLVLMGPSMSRAMATGMTPGYGASSSAMLAPMMGMMGLFSLAGLVGFFGYPLIIGAVSCSVTAAVRGQRIEFEQCWAFVKPRYGGMLLQIFLGILVAGAIGFAAVLGFGIIFGLGAFVIASLANSLGSAGILLAIVGIIAAIAFYIFLLIVGSGFYAWLMMIPIVAAMEDNRRSGGALGRAWELMRGGWKRAAGLILLSSIGISIISWIFQLIAMALVGGFTSSNATTAESAVAFLSSMIVSTFSIPLSILIVALFYLDQRVRHEALDLEWASYAGSEPNAPTSPSDAPNNEYSNAPYATAPYATATHATATHATATHAPAANDSYAPTYAPPADTARTYSSPGDNPFDASTEDLASMSLDDLMPKKKPSANEIARAQTDTVAALGLPQVPDYAGATPNVDTSNQTQILPQATAFSTDVADVSSGDITSSTRSDDAPVYTPKAEAPQNEVFGSAPAQNATKTCAQCGAQVSATQNFCLTCGARL